MANVGPDDILDDGLQLHAFEPDVHLHHLVASLGEHL